MTKALRHALYWLAVAIGIIPILLALAGYVVYELLDACYAHLRRWAFSERYVRLDR